MVHGLYVEVEPVIKKFLAKGIHFYQFCGGRGIGKTYGALDLCRKIGTGEHDFDCFKQEKDAKFLYLRRTGVEAESIASPEACPFKKYNKEEGYQIFAEFSSSLGYGQFFLNEDAEVPIGYGAALSTFANLRGVDFSDVVLILYDECVPENKNKHPLKEEGYLFLNMVETINRNRALEGRQEVVTILLNNAIDLGADLLSQLNLTPILNNMIFKNQERYTSYERSLHIEKYKDHPVSKMKEQESVLYKFAKGTGFNERALSGDFIDNDLTIIKKVNLEEYKAFMSLENLCVYEHKSNGEWYISQIMMPAKYKLHVYEREMVRDVFYWKYKRLVIERMVYYDSFQTKTVFDAMIKYKPTV